MQQQSVLGLSGYAVAPILQAAGVMTGYLWGTFLTNINLTGWLRNSWTAPTDKTWVAVVGALLMALGSARITLNRPSPRLTVYFSWAAFSYTIYCFLTEPFMNLGDEYDLGVGLATLLPGLFFIGFFTRHRMWLSSIGTTLFVSAAAALLSRNAGDSIMQVGFITYSIS